MQDMDLVTKIALLEKDMVDLQKQYDGTITKVEFENQISHILEQIKDLKLESMANQTTSVALQKTLARLEEFTKYLKESLDNNRETTKQLMDKVDKMYELMLKTLSSSSENNNHKRSASNEIKIINDSNKGNSSRIESPVDSKLLEFAKANAFTILVIVCFIIYEVTGRWVLPLGH